MTWLGAFLLLALWGAPQQTAQTGARWPIESLTVTGNSRYSSGQILAASGLKTGQVVGKEELEAARNRLMDSGAFSGVAYSYGPAASRKGYRVEFEVIEAPYVYPFRFERLEAAAEELTAALKRADPLFADQIPATQPALDRYAKVIEEFLASRNHKAEVAARVDADESGKLVVVFSPAAPPPVVAEIRFVGNKAIDSAKLQNTMAGVAIGVPYTESRFQQLLEANIRPLYEALGRVRVSFPKVTAQPAKDVNGVAVEVLVEEGDVYELDTVRLEAPGLPVQELLDVAKFKTGETADFSEIRAGLDRIRKRLARQGYLKPEVKMDWETVEPGKKVQLTVRATAGPSFTFGKLIIEGLDLNGEAAIRRIWTMKPGDPYNGEYPEYFLQRVREDGVFDNLRTTAAIERIDEKNLTVDVTLRFR